MNRLTVASHKKMMVEHRRNTRTNCTATPMDTNVSMGMTVHIVCTQRRDTDHVPQQRIQWEVVYYTNDYQNAHDSIG